MREAEEMYPIDPRPSTVERRLGEEINPAVVKTAAVRGTDPFKEEINSC